MKAILLTMAVLVTASVSSAADLPGFRKSAWFEEQIREQAFPSGVRVLINATADFEASKPTRLILFANPNGNTIEQTLGCTTVEGIDWHFDIQHVAAQVRKLRSLSPKENLVLACLEAEGLSWPAWKRRFSDGPARIRQLVETLKSWLPGDKRITLSCHSGGGSFLWGYLDSQDAIPAEIERFVFLDANYSYSDADKHGDKLLNWLKADASRKLVVIAYDDREVKLNGKNIVSADGGTFRATDRMRKRIAADIPLTESADGPFIHRMGLNGQIALHVHRNPEQKILHTALVGDMNGLLRGLTDDWPRSSWGTFGGPRAYTPFVQPAPGIPARPADAIGGRAFFASLTGLDRNQREAAVWAELRRGNIPAFLRSFAKVTVTATDSKGKDHKAELEVMPDYLAIGSDSDFVRIPMTPMTAARVADLYGCSLPTRKLVNDIYQAAGVKREPRPMTKERESAATFLQHHDLIESQLVGQKRSEIVAGTKKDVVLSNRIGERPNRVAIYGWHMLDGKPIQPLTIVHVNWYVDYSHGIRLVKRAVRVDGQSRDIRQVLLNPELAPLLSDEGVVLYPGY